MSSQSDVSEEKAKTEEDPKLGEKLSDIFKLRRRDAPALSDLTMAHYKLHAHSYYGNEVCVAYFKKFNSDHPVCPACKLYPIELDYVKFSIEVYPHLQQIDACCLLCLYLTYQDELKKGNDHFRSPADQVLVAFCYNNKRKMVELATYYDENIQYAFWKKNKETLFA